MSVDGRCVKSLIAVEKRVRRSEHLCSGQTGSQRLCFPPELETGRCVRHPRLCALLGAVWLRVIFCVRQLHHRSKCKIHYLGTLCGFVTLPVGLRIHKPMNGLQQGINIVFSWMTYNPTQLLFLSCKGKLYLFFSSWHTEISKEKKCLMQKIQSPSSLPSVY